MKSLNWLLFAVMVGISAYAVLATLHVNFLRSRMLALHSRHEQAHDLLSDERTLRSRVGVLLNRQDFYVRCLADLLSYCQSRDEFLVREGPWLIVGKLKTPDKQSQHFGVYLPAGRHVLKFATVDFSPEDKDGQLTRQQFFSDAPHNLTNARSVVLEGTPQVFELRFSWRTGPGVASVRMQVVGKENAVVFEQVQRFSAQQVKVRFPITRKYADRDRLCTVAYPSELLIGKDVPQRPADGHYPYTRLIELSGLMGKTESSGFRAWVESDAPPCISALKLARHFDEIMTWREPVSFKQLEAFSDLFLPYDGSGKYVFRAGGLESLFKQHDGTRFAHELIR